jgi:hypothetical protein
MADADIDIVLNMAVDDIAAYTACLKANKKFNAVASQSEYNLSTVIGNYLVMDKPGLWWYDGSAWKQINSTTLKGLDNNKYSWRGSSAGSPEDYSIDGDVLTITPAPSSSGTEYFWLYYGKIPTAMSAEASYPFSGTTTEFTHLRVFDRAILRYAKSMLSPALNKLNEENLTWQEYLAAREEALYLFKRRPDIAANSQSRMTGPSVRA